VASAPSRFEVEHLHRLMIQASVEAAQLDQRLDEARNADSLWPVLRQWSEAAEALDDAVERASPALQREGTPKDQIDRIRERLITSSSAAGSSTSTSISMSVSRPGARSATTSRSSRAAIATPSSFSCGITSRPSTR